jgi:putative membrane protein
MSKLPLALALALGGLALPLPASDAAPTVARGDQEFVDMASQGGLFEVRASEMATKRAIGGPVQEFALMMIDDHGQANRALTSLAAKKNIEVANLPDRTHEELLERLGSTGDRDFAKEYVALQVRAHKDAPAAG